MGHVRGILAFAFIAVNTVVWCTPLYLMGLVRALLPARAKVWINGPMVRIIDGWVACNRAMVRVLGITRIDAKWHGEPLARDGWYLVFANHQSWTDIIVLQNTLLGRIPPLRFFTKRELIWAPLVGVAMWLLGFPYVRRHSRAALEANPALRGQDREAVVRACAGFRERPTSVLAFLEGTRFTTAKHAAQESRYRHLLNPRSGGFGYALDGLADKVPQAVDVTIVYEGEVPGFWDFLCGRCRRVRFVARTLPPPENDRDAIGAWIEERWLAKDAELDAVRNG